MNLLPYFLLFMLLFPNLLQAKSIDNMPLVRDNDILIKNGTEPIGSRDEKYLSYLDSSVQIKSGDVMGSGTIIYYDSKLNLAYVASCGHLWKSNNKRAVVEILVFYKNGIKLNSPVSFKGKILFHQMIQGCDSSLLTFQPDWPIENYFPIAPVNYYIEPGSQQHSLGCDSGTNPAHYDIEFLGVKEGSYITQENSPRPGRSGGGLLSSDGYYIGTCWGTTEYDGTGYGFFTPLEAIHKYFTQQGFAWLLSLPPPNMGLAQKIPVINVKTLEHLNPSEYILMPFYSN